MNDMLEYERLALGALLSNPDLRDEMGLVEEDFTAQSNKCISQAINEMLDRGESVDLMLLADRLEFRGQLVQSGGITYLTSMISSAPARENAVSYAKVVKRMTMARKCVQAGEKIAVALSSSTDIESRLAEAAQVFDGLTMVGTEQDSHIPLGSAITSAIEHIENKFSNGNAEPEFSFGFSELDEMTQGASPGDLIIIAGRPSMGKTALAMNVTEHAAGDRNKRGLVCSIEMPAQQLALRMLGSVGRISMQALRSGNLTDDDFGRITYASSKCFNDMKLYIDESSDVSPGSIRRAAQQTIKKLGGLDFIVVDYLQLMRGDKTKYDNRGAEIADISRSMKLLAKKLGVPIFLLSQLNRSLEQRPNKRPVMSDLRESGSIEQDADIILFVYRDEVYNPDSAERGTAEIIIAKQRNGPIGTVRTAFRGDITKFEDFSRGSA